MLEFSSAVLPALSLCYYYCYYYYYYHYYYYYYYSFMTIIQDNLY